MDQALLDRAGAVGTGCASVADLLEAFQRFGGWKQTHIFSDLKRIVGLMNTESPDVPPMLDTEAGKSPHEDPKAF